MTGTCGRALIGRIGIAACGVLGTASLLRAQARTAKDEAPNVVLFLADDLGYHDLGVQGMTDIPTPNIDAIAHGGIQFTDAYVVSPLCSVSRAGLLTGRYPQRWGHEFNPRPSSADSAFGVPKSVPLLPERLKALGYATGVFGKWHLGYFPPNRPNDRGFDEFLGFLGALHRYRTDQYRERPGKLLHNTTRVEQKGFLTDVIATEAVKFVDAHANGPFLLYVPFNAVHPPLEPDKNRLARAASIQDPKRRLYAQVLMGVDDAVGAVMQAIARHGLREKTIVIFVSDNGGPTMVTTSSNAPLKGIKGGVHDGSIRVPFLISWPGHIAAGQKVSSVISTLDVMPTVLAAAGAKTAANDFDGLNLLPSLAGKAPTGHVTRDRLFWRMGEESAARDGPWKLVQILSTPPLLYDLATDIGEEKDVSKAHPEIVARLQNAFATWASQMQQPKWGKGLTNEALEKQRAQE